MPMDDPELESFRQELRTWLDRNLVAEFKAEAIAALSGRERVDRLRAWQGKLASGRWVGITWPKEFGGREATIPQQIAHTEEMSRARSPEVLGSLGIGIAGPPLIAYGSESQKERFVRR